MQTGLKDLESENHFMLEQQLVPFAVLLIPQYKHKLNWSIYTPKQSKTWKPHLLDKTRQKLFSLSWKRVYLNQSWFQKVTYV